MADALKNADVEVKTIASDEAAESACRLLGLEADEGKGLTVYFWDKPWADGDDIRLPLSEAGVTIRLRKPAKGDADDLTVKLRPCIPEALPADWRASRDGEDWEFKIEEDWSGRNRVWAASLKVEDDFDRPTADGGGGDGDSHRPRLTRDQRDLLASVGVTDDDLEGIVPLGPVQATKWKPSRRDLIHPLAAEFWSVGPDLRLLELSLRVRPAEASTAQDLLERALLDLGLQSPQASKTRSVLTALARAHLNR
ncbi:hypothetical protein [Streptomyces netropsis]|uniref:CYTH domain-containing protein n=1 Tax=Streptomyces netropsis TaxID=55404 RepID=A0A7W7LD13_STRNE|nr:hypothetical protein [Streptomyces netropsis]MBB4887970.1 hypothetical protein [Streptomyces netropsis]GGR33005.1 hypothetical protein GCM10010219_42370 [Streptomyces netropsis]